MDGENEAMKQRDIFQRKCTALHRMSLAAKRLSQATSMSDREKARSWMAMWSTVSGIRKFKLGNGGGSPKKRSS
jgi:hypothetical protein